MYSMTSYYLLFGPQNNGWGNLLYTKNIGNYVAFKVPLDITATNWIDYKPLIDYFDKIKFDPQDLLFSDCYSCGDRWDDESVYTIEDIDTLLKFIDKNKVLIIHDIETSNVTQYGEFKEGSTILNDEETDEFYRILSIKSASKDDWDQETYNLRLWFHNS